MSTKAQGLAHVGIPCTDLNKSITFYQQFGFEVAARLEGWNGYNIAMIRSGDCTVELYQSLDAEERAGIAARTDGHVDHIAVMVDDLDEMNRYCQEKGYEVVSNGIESMPIFAPASCRYFFITGPDGDSLEFVEVKD